MPDNVRRYKRCHFCGCATYVLMPPGASDLDVSARFSEQGREFAQTEDGDPVGVACHTCARRYQPTAVNLRPTEVSQRATRARTETRTPSEVRVATAGWFVGAVDGIGATVLVMGGNPYVGMFLLLAAVGLWETLRRAAWRSTVAAPPQTEDAQ